MRPAITIFGGSHTPLDGGEYGQARELGRLLAASGYDVVNGGYGGSMEASGRGAREAGGRVTGVTVAHYGNAQAYVDREVRTGDFWQRTRRMIELAAGFVVLPGSTGTLAEFACTWELIHKDLTGRKPLVFLGDYWRPLVRVLCPDPGSKPWCRGAVALAATPAEAVRFLDEFLGRSAVV